MDETEPKGSVVYFLAAWDVNRVKIGTTTRRGLPRRLHHLITASPIELKLLGYQDGGRRLERWLHEEFASARVGGEWFDMTPEIIRHVEENTTNERPSVPQKGRDGGPKKLRKRRQPLASTIDHVDGSAVVKLKVSADDAAMLYRMHGCRKTVVEPELTEIIWWLVSRQLGQFRRRLAKDARKAMTFVVGRNLQEEGLTGR